MKTITSEITPHDLERVTGGTSLVSDDIFGTPNTCERLDRAALTAVRHGYYGSSRLLANAARACRKWSR